MKTLFALMAVGGVTWNSGGAYAQDAELQVAALGPDVLSNANNLVVAHVDLSDQTMHVYVGGRLQYIWHVSTGLGSYRTPTGEWNAYWLSPNHRSSKYNNAPMPWSVFYVGGYAIHGTTALDQLGQPASHGCVRLDPGHAQIFFRLVEENGLGKSLVMVVD